MVIDGHEELDLRHRRFIEEYLRDPRPKAAAIRAGYKETGAARTAWRLLHHPAIASVIRAAQRDRSERLRVSIDRVVLEHARLALADIGRLVRLTPKGPRLRDPSEIGADESAAVREVIRRKGGFQIKLYDKTKSLQLLTEMLGVAKRYQTDSAAAEEDREKYLKNRDKFLAMVRDIRDRLGLDHNSSPMEQLAEGAARGDPMSAALADGLGYGPNPRPEKKPPLPGAPWAR